MSTPKKILGGLAALAAVGVVAGAASSSPSPTKPTAATAAVTKAAKRTAPKSKPKLTTSQQNAVESAKRYLELQAFSKRGLIEQLSSSAGDGFPKADARFAVNHIDVDWNEQAVRSAKQYLQLQSFSRSGLVEQLSSSAGEGFTLAQAQHAVAKAYR